MPDEQKNIILRVLDLATGRSAFRQRVFDYLEGRPLLPVGVLPVGVHPMRKNLEAVLVTLSLFGTDIQVTFTLKDPATGTSGSRAIDPKELARKPPPEPSSSTFGVEQEVVGDQVFHFTFTSRRDFETQRMELESMVRALYRGVEERRSLNHFFYDQLDHFLKSPQNGVVSAEPPMLPATEPDVRTEGEATSSRRRSSS